MVARPTEACIARDGYLISLATGGPAKHRDTPIPNDLQGRMANYSAVIDWMDRCDLVFDGAYIKDYESVLMVSWTVALVVIGADWADEFLHRHVLGLDPLPMALRVMQRAMH
jgi:hypothetical protein